MRLVNTTNIPNETIRAIIRAVRPAGIANFDVRISNTRKYAAGTAYTSGSAYHSNASQFLVVRVARTDAAARLRVLKPRRGGYLPHCYGSRIEALLFVAAHELRHLWQANHSRGKVYGSRGKMSERDADAYALQMLRRYRRGELTLSTEVFHARRLSTTGVQIVKRFRY